MRLGRQEAYAMHGLHIMIRPVRTDKVPRLLLSLLLQTNNMGEILARAPLINLTK